jgi:hypothetical protein
VPSFFVAQVGNHRRTPANFPRNADAGQPVDAHVCSKRKAVIHFFLHINLFFLIAVIVYQQ